MTACRNPAHLLGLDNTPALALLMRACGAAESCITGRASDYDRFLALAAALPLCEGHPEATRVQDILTQATGMTAPLCPHTARLFWERWTEEHWYGRTLTPLTHTCPLCVPPAPTVVDAAAITVLPDPAAVGAPDLEGWSIRMTRALPASGDCLLTLEDGYTFIRPDPYHASLALRRLEEGECLTVEERSVLMAQALRVWGLTPVKEGRDSPRILLRGGSPQAVMALLAYLEASKALPAMVWIPRDPSHAEAVSGLYRGVGTGYAIPAEGTAAEADALGVAYAAVAPLGCAVVLRT